MTSGLGSDGAPGGSLRGKRAIVVGAGGRGNIGQAIARAFFAEGAEVVVAGRTMATVVEFAEKTGGLALACDIGDPRSVEQLFEHAAGPVDIAVNATGKNLFRPFMETSPADVANLTAVHVTGLILFIQNAVRAMPSGGSIIHLSSLTARLVMADHVAYMATKAAAEVVVRAAAIEFGARGIRVNAIAPALTRTPMTEAFFAHDDAIAAASQGAPLRRIGTVKDIADAALWLASDACFMTGEVLQVNGGMAIQALAS